MANEKIEGAVRKLRAVMDAFDMKGTNRATMLNAIDTIENLNTRPAGPVEGLEVVSYEVFYAPTREWTKTTIPNYYRDNDNLVRELVTRSQSEAIIATERKQKDHFADLAERRFEELRELKADNAALTATMERLRDSTEPMATDPDEWTAAEEVLAHLLINVIGVPDDVTYTPNEAQKIIERQLKQAEALETQLAAARDALEIVSNAHASNPSLAMADVPEADYVRHVLYEMRKLARAALEAKP